MRAVLSLSARPCWCSLWSAAQAQPPAPNHRGRKLSEVSWRGQEGSVEAEGTSARGIQNTNSLDKSMENSWMAEIWVCQVFVLSSISHCVLLLVRMVWVSVRWGFWSEWGCWLIRCAYESPHKDRSPRMCVSVVCLQGGLAVAGCHPVARLSWRWEVGVRSHSHTHLLGPHLSTLFQEVRCSHKNTCHYIWVFNYVIWC